MEHSTEPPSSSVPIWIIGIIVPGAMMLICAVFQLCRCWMRASSSQPNAVPYPTNVQTPVPPAPAMGIPLGSMDQNQSAPPYATHGEYLTTPPQYPPPQYTTTPPQYNNNLPPPQYNSKPPGNYPTEGYGGAGIAPLGQANPPS